ncbi:helix-turn-helix domain-containing protein [Sphingomonas sp. RS6]
MYHDALIAGFDDKRTGSAVADGGARASALLAGAIRSLDTNPPLARRYLECLSTILAADQPEPAAGEALIPDRAAGDDSMTRGGLAAWQIRRVTAHIAAHLSEPLTIDTLAAVAQLSPGHFCRAFKVSLGEPPHAYLVRQRIRRAQRLMLDTSDGLSQIAFACGLADQAHLTRLFRRLIGTTPMAWRRTWQNAA